MKKIAVLFLAVSFFSACENSDDDGRHSCYDPSIVHNNACTTDCPGVTGCDDQFYCNDCEAARAGIRPK